MLRLKEMIPCSKKLNTAVGDETVNNKNERRVIVVKKSKKNRNRER